MNVSEIRGQLADALRGADLEVAENRQTVVLGFPAAIINLDSMLADSFVDGSFSMQFTVTVLVSKADSEDGWHKLDDLLSANTVADVLREAECVATVGAYDNIGDDVAYDGGVALGFTIAVEVLA